MTPRTAPAAVVFPTPSFTWQWSRPDAAGIRRAVVEGHIVTLTPLWRGSSVRLVTPWHIETFATLSAACEWLRAR